MELPAINEEVSLSRIREICAFYKLPDLWEKIEKDPPPSVFKSDGCTMWPDNTGGKDIYPACFLHDLKYWAGYPSNSQFEISS